MNFDSAELVTLKCLQQPAGSGQRGCYGKYAFNASEKTEILTLASLHMTPSLVNGSAGLSGPAFKLNRRPHPQPSFNTFNTGQGVCVS